MPEGLSEVLKQIRNMRIIPLVTIDVAADAAPLADALVAGGLPIIEITYRTAAAGDAIRLLAKHPSLLIGAGTVLNIETAQSAVDSGAKFIVSPGFNPKVVQWCIDHGVPILPGTATPTEIEMALDHGLKAVKFFPAEAVGGIKTLEAIAAPYSMMRFVPTGGVSLQSMGSYLKFPRVLAIGGSWMVARDLLASRNFSRVAELVREAVAQADIVRPRSTIG